MIPTWAIRYLAQALILAAIFFAGFKSGQKWDAGKIEKAVAARQAAEWETADRDKTIEVIRSEMASLRLKLDEAKLAARKADEDYQRELAKLPREIVRWRDRRVEVPVLIGGDTCEARVDESVEVFRGAIAAYREATGGSP